LAYGNVDEIDQVFTVQKYYAFTETIYWKPFGVRRENGLRAYARRVAEPPYSRAV